MKRLLLLALLVGAIAHAQKGNGLAIVPKPASVQVGQGQFRLTKETVIVVADEADRRTAAYLADYLQRYYRLELDVDRKEGRNYIRLTTRKFIQAPDKDGYTLQIDKNGIRIEGDTYAGTFYGVQTLLQLLNATPNPKHQTPNVLLPFITVQDYPRFNYRGMHLDVSRHFSPVDYVKRYIDYLALHKLNAFHWHLTDDQGWRIQIRKHPRLTEVGAWRHGTLIGRYPGTSNDNQRYGGFYTQDDVREVVRYAADRHITVIPEIEMPGHASAAIAAYPWLSCFPQKPTLIPSHPSAQSVARQAAGEVKQVQETWGVFDDIFCAGKDSTFLFLQDVLDEVVALFPSTYIHIGGDEAPKTHWKVCPACQARIKSEGLKDEHELQSWFVRRIENYLNKKGRMLIGWDEILEGGLAPNAVVMSWRGEKGGIVAAKQKHQVIMTPDRPLYFDHAQSRNEDSLVIGGYNPLEAVYAYNPVPKELDSAAAAYVLGAQANLWREYITNPSKTEYMLFPRLAALSEVLWTPLDKKDWTDFQRRLPVQLARYESWGINYSKAYFDVRTALEPAPGNNGLLLRITPVDSRGTITYSLDEKARPVRYTKPVLLTKSDTLRMQYHRDKALVNALTIPVRFTKSTGKKVSIATPPQPRYPGQGGAFSLVNGIWSNKGLSHPDWLGWIGDDLVATIDLGKPTAIDSVRLHTLDQNGSWVYLPPYVEVLTSANGKGFTSAGRSSAFVRDTLTMGWITVPVEKRSPVRYVRVVAKNYGLIPNDRPGAGTKAWLFADEIQVH